MIDAVGMASDQVLGVVIDDRVALEQIHPTYSLALLPLRDSVKVSFEDALFYADCLAYEHEIPVIAHPKKADIGIHFLIDKRGKRTTRDEYIQHLKIALESVLALRLGPLAYLYFRHNASPTGYPVVHLNYSKTYARVAKEIHLYSFGLKQIDPLSEYLCCYRVIESASRSNGLKWMAANLKRLPSVRFGMIPVTMGDPWRQRRTNLLTVLRHRATVRLRDLLKMMSYTDVANRLYYINRCGIAHGRSIRKAHFSTDYTEVYLDCFIVKLMARLAIEDKL